MPELTAQSTAAPATPPVPPGTPPIPPEVDPPEAPPAVPPIIDPARFEDYPALRETFLVYITDPTANATLRGLGELLHTLILEYWRFWPNQPEGLLRASLRAVVADMRYLQGYLAEWAGPETEHKSRHEEHLAKQGGEVARELGRQADRLEAELGLWRGEA
jgi:hypothetical protein